MTRRIELVLIGGSNIFSPRELLFWIGYMHFLTVLQKAGEVLAGADDRLSAERVRGLLEQPHDPEKGDVALPCYALRDTFEGQSPPDIAEQLQSGVSLPELFDRAEVQGPYLNLFLNRPFLVSRTINEVLQQESDWGRVQIGEGEPVVIDYSSPNIAKPFSVGHLRSTAIGGCLYRLYDYLGYKTIGINHLGDWGTQCGKQLLAFEKWGDPKQLEEDGVEYLQSLYVRVNKEIEEEQGEQLKEQAREWFRRLEEEDPRALQLWERFRDVSIEYLESIYDRLGVTFDHYRGESHYRKQARETIAKAKEAGIVEESEGALIVPFAEEDMPPFLLQKGDGSTLYATRDLAAALERHEEFGADRLLYVVASEQTLHFKQLFRTLEQMGEEWVQNCDHVRFGLVRFGDGKKMSTRKGQVVLLEDLLENGIKKTREILEQRPFSEEKKERLAEQIGIGAVLFADLKDDRVKDIDFDWDRAIGYDENTGSFRGETGPYLQYTHVRLCGIGRKYDSDLPETVDTTPLDLPEEFQLVKKVSRFPAVLKTAARDNQPSEIATYLIDLAQSFNTYYHDRESHQVISDDSDLTDARFSLCEAIRHTLAAGMKLLGVAPIDRM